jgi:hypothetical protein
MSVLTSHTPSARIRGASARLDDAAKMHGTSPGIAGTKAPLHLDRFESLLVAAVEAQPNSKVKMTECEVRVQLDRAARMRYGGPDVASPMACLREHIFGLRVLTIARQGLKGGFPCLTHR